MLSLEFKYNEPNDSNTYTKTIDLENLMRFHEYNLAAAIEDAQKIFIREHPNAFSFKVKLVLEEESWYKSDDGEWSKV